MDDTRHKQYSSFRDSQRGRTIQSDNIFEKFRARYDHNNTKTNSNLYSKQLRKCVRNVALLLAFITPETLASTTVSSPNATSQGVVNNNASMILPSSHFTNKYSQGIVCSSPTLTLSPYVSKTHSFNLPRVQTSVTPIYDEDTGDVLYHSELPRFEKDSHNYNWGGALQFTVPLGKGIDLCHKAVRTNIEAQELLITSTRLDIELKRLRICTEQAKLGAVFTGKYAVSCEGIKVTIPPGQVKPHVHSLSSSEK